MSQFPFQPTKYLGTFLGLPFHYTGIIVFGKQTTMFASADLWYLRIWRQDFGFGVLAG